MEDQPQGQGHGHRQGHSRLLAVPQGLQDLHDRSKEETYTQEFPFDILELLTNFLPVSDVLTMITVCKQWSELGRHSFWCTYLHKRFKILPRITEEDEHRWKSLGLAIARKGRNAWVPIFGNHETIGDYRDFIYSNIGGPQWVGENDDHLVDRRPFWQINIEDLPQEIRNCLSPSKQSGLMQCARRGSEPYFRHVTEIDKLSKFDSGLHDKSRGMPTKKIIGWKLTMDFAEKTIYDKNFAFDAYANRIVGMKFGGFPVIFVGTGSTASQKITSCCSSSKNLCFVFSVYRTAYYYCKVCEKDYLHWEGTGTQWIYDTLKDSSDIQSC